MLVRGPFEDWSGGVGVIERNPGIPLFEFWVWLIEALKSHHSYPQFGREGNQHIQIRAKGVRLTHCTLAGILN